jgi:hypothetical protein
MRLASTFDGATVIADPDLARADRSASGRNAAKGRPPAPAAVDVQESEAMGSRGVWLGVRSAKTSVLMVSGPGNPGDLTPRFVRTTDTPMLCAAPFFHDEMLLGPGNELDWTWSVLATYGAMPMSVFAAAAGVPPPLSGPPVLSTA